jgi:hypothetical protein
MAVMEAPPPSPAASLQTYVGGWWMYHVQLLVQSLNMRITLLCIKP